MADIRRLDWIITKAETSESRLSDWERKFIDDLGRRRERLGDRLTLSDRQWEILEDIAEKAV